MDRDTAFFPSSPTNSSPSSTDLDTESTGSFFPDRSTTLGTLMGVNFAPNDATLRRVADPSQRERCAAAVKKAAERQRRRGSRDGRGSWWRLCRDDMVGPTSLGELLQVERRSVVGEGVAGADVAEGKFFVEEEEHGAVGGVRLFKNGRVLPPPPETAVAAAERKRSERLPVLLAGICSGGDG